MTDNEETLRIVSTIEAYTYEEWQIAEGDAHMASDTEDASYHIGQADAFRDVFIRLRRAFDPEFDFQKFVLDKIANDEDFVINGFSEGEN